ncbi:MAG: prepilin-type N-terminal cleavage/methylation domain-containing protein [Fimbriimonadaceae bacterium]|nr:prepilin-type N-terminal cleavage/methylation domain-containing protein [Fimbriimonadaceae bacterium]
MDSPRKGFTLIELLVVIAIIAILAAILFPVFARAKDKAKQIACLSNMKQLGTGIYMYLSDYNDYLPDRRDLKTSLPGGYRPWTSWPPSDPRSGWAAVVFDPYIKNNRLWTCPNGEPLFRGVVQAEQTIPSAQNPAPSTYFWMWRFDRFDDPIPLDNFWGKSPEQCVFDLRDANNPQAGMPDGVADIELIVDPYFPKTIPSVLANLKGKTPHFGGRNRVFLDTHAKFLRDIRTD